MIYITTVDMSCLWTKKLFIPPRPRLSNLLEQLDQFLQFGPGQMIEEFVMQVVDAVDPGRQSRHPQVRESHVDHTAILFATQPVAAHPRLFQPVDQSSNPGNNGRVRLAISKIGKGLPSPLRSQDVVLRGGQPVLPKQPRNVIAAHRWSAPGSGPLPRRAVFFQFVLQFRGRHGRIHR